MDKKSQILLGVIVIFFILVRLPQIISGNFAFVFDMGRDMLWTRDMVVLGKPYLIGPWGSLQGIFFGPAWYYLLAIPFFLTGGDPRGSVLLVMLVNFAVLMGMFILGKKTKDTLFGVILSALVASSTLLISISAFPFHANLLPFTSFLMILSFFLFVRGKIFYLILAAFSTSINFHLEPATAIFSTLTLVIFCIWQYKIIFKNIKVLFLSLFVYSVPFFPQILFELRHNFMQTRAAIAYFSGNNESLGGVLPLGLRFQDRIGKFVGLFSGSVAGWNIPLLAEIFIVLTTVLIIYEWKKTTGRIKSLIVISLMVLLVPFVSYILFFPPELKGWYLYGLAVPYIILGGWGLYLLISSKLKVLGVLAIFIIIILNSNIISRLESLASGTNSYNGLETLVTQEKTIDWIYNNANGNPFSVYVYTAPIYDYHYQYLFWWYGKKEHGYWPEEYGYEPAKIDYVPYKQKYMAMQTADQPGRNPEYIYLLIESDSVQSRRQAWIDNYNSYNLLEKHEFDNGIVIEKREFPVKVE